MTAYSTIERYSQPADVNAVIDRTQYSIASQNVIADSWTWPEMSTAAWQLQLDGVIDPETGLKHALLMADQDLSDAEIDFKVGLEELHETTVTALGVARIRWRGVDTHRIALAQLSALGRSAAETLEEAELLELAWEEIDPAFTPTDTLTLAVFSAQRAAVAALVRPLRRARIRRALAAGRLSAAILALDDLAQAWYAMATSVFPEGSGAPAEVIRNVPTTYVPRYAEAAKKRRAAKRAAAKEAGGAG